MWAILTLAATLALVASEALLAQPASLQSSGVGTKVWLGRHAEYEEFLRTAEIEKLADIPVGVTRPRRAFFKKGGLCESAAIRSLKPGRYQGYWESFKSETAAYELDKLLKLDMVPPTVERRVEGDLASAQLWVDSSVWLKTLKGQSAPDIPAWNRQVYRHRIWDNLTANIDRNEGNLLVVRDPQWHLILIDHTRAFTALNKINLFPMTKIDRPFFEALKNLDVAALEERVGKHIPDGTKSLLKRRDLIVAHFEKLAGDSGEASVFIP